MKIIDITSISLNDLRAAKDKLKEQDIEFKIRANDLIIIDEPAFTQSWDDDSELRDLLTNMEDPINP